MHESGRRIRAATIATLSAAGLVFAASPGTTAVEPTPRSAGDHNFDARDYNGVPNCDSAKSIAEANQTGDNLGTACYKREGDIFFVRDDEQDGHHVAVHWVVEGDSNGWGNCHDYLGGAAVWTSCNIPNDLIPEGEGYRVNFEVRIQEGSDILDRGNDVRSRT
jgi:hypothetical protein